MNIISIIIWLAISVLCAYVHNSKGYSPIAGFLWGFCFTIIGLIVVLLEKDKDEHEMEIANKNSLSMGQWLCIFLGIGIILIIIFFMAMKFI